MTTLDATITETLRYQGKLGQWSRILHRLGGLGTLLFLAIHVLNTSWVAFYPAWYEEVIAIYQTPLFVLGEFFLVGLVVFHAFNGLRIAVLDYRLEWWQHQARATQIVFLATAVVLVPILVLMAQRVIEFYTGRAVDLQSGLIFTRVVLPLGGGMILALLAGVGLSVLLDAMGREAGTGPQPARNSRFEGVLWGLMRGSGILILPLVFGHLAIMQVFEGVFAINQSATGLAANFVAARWVYLGWRLYDAALLVLALLHGFNGLRYVINDYAARPAIRRGLNWAALAACAALIIVGVLALINGVPGT
jgi:succinate dehydrogenase cytochrome b556 subunit